jgi:hypothetical protein
MMGFYIILHMPSARQTALLPAAGLVFHLKRRLDLASRTLIGPVAKDLLYSIEYPCQYAASPMEHGHIGNAASNEESHGQENDGASLQQTTNVYK